VTGQWALQRGGGGLAGYRITGEFPLLGADGEWLRTEAVASPWPALFRAMDDVEPMSLVQAEGRALEATVRVRCFALVRLACWPWLVYAEEVAQGTMERWMPRLLAAAERARREGRSVATPRWVEL